MTAEVPPGDADTTDCSDGTLALGEAVRRLMDVAVLTTCESETLLQAAAEIDGIADGLSQGLRASMLLPDADDLRAGRRPFSPVSGPANPIAPPMVMRVLDDGSVLGEVEMRPIHEGPPGAIHGGWVAALLDQILGRVNIAGGVGGFTAELTVRYRRPTPYGVPLTVRARIDSVDGRQVRSSGEVVADGVVTAEARGLFLQPSQERIEQMRGVIEGRQAAG